MDIYIGVALAFALLLGVYVIRVKRRTHKVNIFFTTMLESIKVAPIEFTNLSYTSYMVNPMGKGMIHSLLSPDRSGKIVIQTSKEDLAVWYLDSEWRFKLENFLVVGKEHTGGLYLHSTNKWFHADSDEVGLIDLSGVQHMDLVRAIYERAHMFIKTIAE